jgi:hypothetical protein
VPPGVWAAEEYEKLFAFTEGECGLPALHPFLCHQTPLLGRDTLCRGWLTVEQESVAVRILLAKGQVTWEQVTAPARVALYATSAEAARAGLAGVETPSRSARTVIRRLQRKRKGIR